jgi:hypothetical protein
MLEVQYIIHCFCWFCNDKGSDKIWGWCEIEGKIYNFWARRGKNLQFKRYSDSGWWDAEDLCVTKAREKIQKGYIKIEPEQIESVYQDFHHEFKKQLFTARITGKVRDEEI